MFVNETGGAQRRESTVQ